MTECKIDLKKCESFCNDKQVYPAMRYFVKEMNLTVNAAAKEVKNITAGLVTQGRARLVWQNRTPTLHKHAPKKEKQPDTEQEQEVNAEPYSAKFSEDDVTDEEKEAEENSPQTEPDLPESNEQFRTSFTGKNEWYTPTKYIESARKVMGTINIDPASSKAAQERIKADIFHTEETDGLKHSWNGSVWLNPPYSQPLIYLFIDKLIREYDRLRTIEAILLTHNYTDTAWFHLAESRAELICFTKGRIRFEDQDGNLASPTQGSAFFYFGENVRKFISEFEQYGFIR